MSNFTGFPEPTANFSKLPHALIDELPNINSLAEMKVILYILRHTWGFNDDKKRISIDEFCNGRKRKDGTRIDEGCGISPNSVRSGLDNAVSNGYITVEEDASDLGRITRFYSIKQNSELTQKLNSGVQLLNPTPSRVEPPPLQELNPVHRKKPGERNIQKEIIISGDDEKQLSPRPAGFGEVCKAYEQNIGLLTATIGESIAALLEQDAIPAEWAIDAIKIACEQEKRNLAYVKGICNRWKQNGRTDNKQPAKEKPVSGIIEVFNQYTGKMEKVNV